MRWIIVLIPILLFPVIAYAFSSGEKIRYELNCLNCHTRADEYPSHSFGICYDCHGADVHPIHSFDCRECHVEDPLTPLCHGAPPGVEIPKGEVVCYTCHGSDAMVVHSCQDCHADVLAIHSKADLAGGVER
ncbi:MAG: hypothetical protein ABWW66_02605 [Archaeoglobaceae archaeon]